MSIDIYVPEGATSSVFRVICTYEPRGDHGLEGFLLNEEYQAEIDRKDRITLYLKDLAGDWQPAGRVSKGITTRFFAQVKSTVESGDFTLRRYKTCPYCGSAIS